MKTIKVKSISDLKKVRDQKIDAEIAHAEMRSSPVKKAKSAASAGPIKKVMPMEGMMRPMRITGRVELMEIEDDEGDIGNERAKQPKK